MKKFTSLVLMSLLTLALVVPASSAKAATVFDSVATYANKDVALYHDIDFYGRSEPEFVTLTQATDTVSVYATCEGDDIDNLTCHISDWNGGSFNYALDFNADGSVTTFPIKFPAGKYKVFFTGNDYILKTDAIVIFSATV